MGLFDWIFGSPNARIPHIPSILPDVAKTEIVCGRLPQINVDQLFLNRGEVCHYADHALLMMDKKSKVVRSRHTGHSMPGILKGNRWSTGYTSTTIDDKIETEEYKGILYITNRRIIFSSKKMGFDKHFKNLSAVKPYSNGIELQYGSTIYSLFVPDGNITYAVIKMLQ